MTLRSDVAAISGYAALDGQSDEFDRGANPELLAHDRRRVGHRLVGRVNEPGDLGETFAGAEQAQDLHLARVQLREWTLGETGACEGDAPRDRRWQVHLALADFADRLDQIVGIAGLRDIALGADLDRARGEYRV